jgi:trk system potassium uptake protein TrkH
MVNRQIIYKIIGSLLFIEAALMTWCLIVTFIYREDDSFSFFISVVTTLLFAFILRYKGRLSDNTLNRREAYLVVTLGWVIYSLFGTLPFLVGGYLSSFTDAYFETMSGFTTTGATIIDDVEALPHGILFWRSLTHWVGGLGIVFFTIALLPSLVGGSVKVFAAEATGPIKSKLHPRLSASAKSIWKVFLILSIACVLCFKIAGMGWFDSVCYSMSILGTGGFATHNTSIEFFHSPAIDYISIIFCFLAGLNFSLTYLVFTKRNIKVAFKNAEFKFYAFVIASITIFIMVELMAYNNFQLEKAFRNSLFQVVSIITTTGLFNDDVGLWPHVTWVALSICMFIGACSGSTSGGLKCIRGVMLFKILKNEFRQILHPKAVLPMKIDGTNVAMSNRVTLLAFFTIYLLIILVFSFIFIAMGLDDTNAITVTLSSLSNVGPAMGAQIGPTQSWSVLPPFIKWCCSLLMLMGRLEVFTVLVIFTPAFWRDN